MNKSQTALIAVLTVIACLVFCTLAGFLFLLALPEAPLPPEPGQVAPIQQPVVAPTAVPESKTEPLEYSGSGGATEQFSIIGYPAIVVDGEHNGERIFAVKVLTSDGRMIGLPINCRAQCNDSGVVRLEGDGDYFLEIMADGEWQVTVTPIE